MSVQGNISVSALFHDADGTTAINVVSLRSSTEYPAGLVAVVTGTAGTAQTAIAVDNVYRDAGGELIQFATPQRIVFSWSGASARALQNVNSGITNMMLRSARSEAAASVFSGAVIDLSIVSGSGTGTYTIVVYGE